jgi:hypothetical protein
MIRHPIELLTAAVFDAGQARQRPDEGVTAWLGDIKLREDGELSSAPATIPQLIFTSTLLK